MNIREKKILFVILAMIAIMFINFFFTNIFIYVNIYYIIFWLISLLIIKYLIGIKKDNYKYKYDSVQIIIIYSFLYLIITYLSGLFFGYVRTPFNLNFIKIIKNIVPIIIIIFLQELFRYIVLKKTNNKVIITLLFLLFIGFDLTLQLKYYNLTNILEIFEMVGNLIIPYIAKNLIIMYLTYNGTVNVAIIYRLIFELYVFFVPIEPDLGFYFDSVLSILFPTILFLRFNTMFSIDKPVVHGKKKLISTLVTLPLIILLILLVALSSKSFSLYALAIGSNSMNPKIYKGDIVIVQKEKDDFEIGDILVFKHEEKVIVHRIIKIRVVNNQYVFNTKGDNNESKDNYDVLMDDVMGKVNLIIPYVGYPSVWLSEQITK